MNGIGRVIEDINKWLNHLNNKMDNMANYIAEQITLSQDKNNKELRKLIEDLKKGFKKATKKEIARAIILSHTRRAKTQKRWVARKKIADDCEDQGINKETFNKELQVLLKNNSIKSKAFGKNRKYMLV